MKKFEIMKGTAPYPGAYRKYGRKTFDASQDRTLHTTSTGAATARKLRTSESPERVDRHLLTWQSNFHVNVCSKMDIGFNLGCGNLYCSGTMPDGHTGDLLF